MINSAGEPPQHIVGPLIDRELKDRFLYHNQNLKTKTFNSDCFVKKGGCLLPAIYL